MEKEISNIDLNYNLEQYENLAMEFLVLFDELGKEGREDFLKVQCPELVQKMFFLKACEEVYNIEGVEQLVFDLKFQEGSTVENLENAIMLINEIKDFINSQLISIEADTHAMYVEGLMSQELISEDMSMPPINNLSDFVKLKDIDEKNIPQNLKKSKRPKNSYKEGLPRTTNIYRPYQKG